MNIENTMLRLKESEKFPYTHIQTDSYVAVQLIEKENALGFDIIRKMAEKTKGSGKSKAVDEQLWNELYRKWQNGEVTAVEFMRRGGLSKSSFYRRVRKR